MNQNMLKIWSNIALAIFHYTLPNGTKDRKSNVLPPLTNVAPEIFINAGECTLNLIQLIALKSPM